MTSRPSRGRPTGPGLDGILVVAKPPGPTSHDVVALVRRLAATKRVGHGGTLDPFASGVLPLFLGRGTRVVEYHLGDRKEYRATVCFGATSSTDDLEGELQPVAGPPVTRDAVEAALPALRGRIIQTPPAYSALKVGGRRAYALARAGEKVELAPREVEIHRLEIVDWDGSDQSRPMAILDVVCSAGTYVRALARDLGAAIGSGAYLGALARIASGPFRLDEAIALDDVRAAAAVGPDRLAALLRPIDAGLDDLPAVVLSEADLPAIARGQAVRAPASVRDAADRPIRLLDADGRLVGFATLRDGRLAPDKVFVAPDPVLVGPGAPFDLVAGVDALRPEHGPLFAVVGVFDGLHLGHRWLLDALLMHARRLGARPAVITFDSHPDEVLVGAAPPLLLDPADRLRLLQDAGVSVVVVQHFDEVLRRTPYDRFVGRITARTRLAGLLMTPDAAFGHERRGTPEALTELGARSEPGFEVVVVPQFALDGRPVSSREIRRLVQSGELAEAGRLLGRPYGVAGAREEPEGASTSIAVSFALPVALPPAGAYGVTVVDAAVPGPAGPAVATIREDPPSIEIAGELIPVASRLRIVFD